MVLASGCSVNAPIQHIVVDQNTVLAKSTDEVMLVNLLRAQNNEPMHFSLVSQFHGSATLTAGLTLGAAFPGTTAAETVAQLAQPGVPANNTTTSTTTVTPGVNTFSPSLTGSVSEMPSFDSTIVDSQSFFQGFLKPIDANTVSHFLYDGWSPRLLTYLLVKRFDLVAAFDYDQCGAIIDADKPKPCPGAAPGAKPLVSKGDQIAYLDNAIFQKEDTGGGDNRINPFVDLVEHFQITGVTSSSDDDTPLFKLHHVSELSGVDKIDGNAFDVKDHIVVRKGGSSPRLILSRFKDGGRTQRSQATEEPLPFFKVDAFNPDALSAVNREADAQPCAKVSDGFNALPCAFAIQANRIYTQDELTLIGKDLAGTTTVPVVRTVDGKQYPLKVQLVLQAELRSPESVFYFVGEYMRKMNQDAENPNPNASDLFLVHQDWPWSGCNDPKQLHPLIVVTRERPAHALLSAELNGTRYYIPDSRYACNGQSMKVLTLLEQLFYLQVSSSDKLGLTPTVHVVQ
jgi:hypothetical protein